MRPCERVPSAGARHPFETYLSIHRVEGLEEGLYRYLAVEHELLVLARGPGIADRCAAGCLGQPSVAAVGGDVHLGGGPQRHRVALRPHDAEARALDAGHVCENLYLACEAIGCGTCAIGAYSQSAMDEFAGVDGKNELVYYIAPVGKVPDRPGSSSQGLR